MYIDNALSIIKAYTAAIFLCYIYLYAPITVDEWHAWFYLYGHRRDVRNMNKAKISKCKSMSPAGIESATPRALNNLATTDR